jgi:5-methylcytosine-specific restriction endonuclease McrA
MVICLYCNKEFTPDKYHPFAKCCSRSCSNKNTSTRWRKNNLERSKEIMKKYDSSEKGKLRREKGKEARQKYQRKWYKENVDYMKEWSKEYRIKNIEQLKKNRIKYKKSIKGILSNRKRACMIRCLSRRGMDHLYWQNIIKKQENKCPLCNSYYGDEYENMELAHIFPFSIYPQLSTETENLIPICFSCNRSMQNKMFNSFCIERGYNVPEVVINYIEKIKKSRLL